MAQLVLGVFTDRDDAETAIEDLEDEGYNPKDMSLIMKDQTAGREIAGNTGANVAGGAAAGATTGAVIGGIAGLLIGAGTIALPGVGAFLIGGPLAAALGLTGAAATTVSGAATGAVAGGILGALMGLGLPKEEATAYESRINEGAILLAVPVNGASDSVAEEILDENNATDIKHVTMPTDRFVGQSRRDIAEADYPDVPATDEAYNPSSSYAVGYKGGRATTQDRKRRATRRSRR